MTEQKEFLEEVLKEIEALPQEELMKQLKEVLPKEHWESISNCMKSRKPPQQRQNHRIYQGEEQR